MKNYWLITTFLISSIFVVGCSAVKTVPVRTETKITERVVPVTIPADSATVSLIFSLIPNTNTLTLSGYSENKTTSVETSIKQDSNKVEIKFKVPERQEQIITRDTATTKDVIVPVAVEKSGSGLTTKTLLPWLVAGILLILLIIIVLIKILR